MPNPNQNNPFEPDRYSDAEAQLGGADNVEKTTYVVGEGTEPERRHRAPAPSAPARGASGAIMAVVVAIVALLAIVYLIGVAR